jgi:phosphinothricin acetyltransferase
MPDDSAEGLVVRPAERRDAAALNAIYNHYIINTPVTFDVEPWTMEQRLDWLAGFDGAGPYRAFVAEEASQLLGFAWSHP